MGEGFEAPLEGHDEIPTALQLLQALPDVEQLTLAENPYDIEVRLCKYIYIL
jgi:hypothetical protein